MREEKTLKKIFSAFFVLFHLFYYICYMKITEILNPIRVCELILNKNENDRALWNIIWDSNVTNQILTQNNGRCYFIVVDGEIYKIGYSDCDGGVKSTISSYRSSGNSGRPSDRTHGIHVLITEQLLLGNSVEIYFHFNPLIKVDLVLMDGSISTIENSISGKILELKNMEVYKSKYNSYPIWNLQESGRPWPTHIQESRNNLLAGHPIKISDIKNRLKS